MRKDDTAWWKNHVEKFLTTIKLCKFWLSLHNSVVKNLLGELDSRKCIRRKVFTLIKLLSFIFRITKTPLMDFFSRHFFILFYLLYLYLIFILMLAKSIKVVHLHKLIFPKCDLIDFQKLVPVKISSHQLV